VIWSWYCFLQSFSHITAANTYEVCVCVLFYVTFNNLSVISWQWLLAVWDAIGLGFKVLLTLMHCAVDTRQVHHPVTLSWYRSWFYPFNAERLAGKQLVPILTPLVWCSIHSGIQPVMNSVTDELMFYTIFQPNSFIYDNQRNQGSTLMEDRRTGAAWSSVRSCGLLSEEVRLVFLNISS